MKSITVDMRGLNDEQREVMNLLVSGRDVFLSGNAGTGKSYVIRRFIDYLEKNERNAIVCAPTGIAASAYEGGTTIHRAFKLGRFDPDKRYKAPKEVRLADVIIIDEISMCRCDLFDAVMGIITSARKKNLKHKCQLVMVGDFFQLPPVVKEGKDKERLAKDYPDTKTWFAFKSRAWRESDFAARFLQTVMRQSEHELVDNLNKLRMGNASCLPYFNQFVNPGFKRSEGVFVASRNSQVDAENNRRLDELSGERATYRGTIEGDYKTGDFPFPDMLEIKRGARVMALHNDERGRFVNGSLGSVLDFDEKTVTAGFDNGNTVVIDEHRWTKTRPVIKTDSEGRERIGYKEIGSYTRIPLRLAYAITMHKSQGQTFDKVVINPRSFADGQLYVALSRCTKPEGLVLTQEIRPQDLRVSPETLKWYSNALQVANEAEPFRTKPHESILPEAGQQQTGGSSSKPKERGRKKYSIEENHPQLAKGGKFADAFARIDLAVKDAHFGVNRTINKGYVGYRFATTKSFYDISLSANADRLMISLLNKPDPAADPDQRVQFKKERYRLEVRSREDCDYAIDLVKLID